MALTNQSRLFRAKAEEAIRRLEQEAGSGMGIEDFAQYRYQVGYIAGIKEAIAILDDLALEKE